MIAKIIGSGPLLCMANFLRKCREVAAGRQDHGAIMEIDVHRHFLNAELNLRHMAGQESAQISDHAEHIITVVTRIAEDHIITEDEERELHAELATLCHRSRNHAAALTTDKLPQLA